MVVGAGEGVHVLVGEGVHVVRVVSCWEGFLDLQVGSWLGEGEVG